MNPRRLLPLTAVCAFTFGAVVDPHTTERITPTAAAVTTTAPALPDVPPPDQPYIYGDCSTLFGTAMRAGWTWVDWPRLARIMWRESRCRNDAYNGRGRDRSYGLLQINTRGALWDQPIGWGAPSLKELCGLTAREDLYDPYTNLRCGRLLFELRGWAPWA